MPTVKVMPDNDGSKKTRSRSRKNSASKGITIEDLKQQTAKRLAKQQVSRQRKNAIRQEQRKGTFTSSPVAPNAVVTPRGGAVVHPAAQVHQHQYPAQPIHHHGHGYNVAQDHYQTRPSFESEQSSASIYSTDSGNYSRTPSQGSSSYHGSAQYNLNHQGHKPSNHHRGQKATQSPYVPLKVQRVGKPNSNFAHGLTVQELKEMTRARLASETEESRSSMNSNPVPVEDASMSSRRRVYSYESMNRQRFDSQESWRSAPSQSNVRRQFMQQRSNPQIQYSRQVHLGSATNLYSPDGDNGSVLSGQGSESYLGSDVSGIYTSGSREFGRSVSFPQESTEVEHPSFRTAASFETGRARVTSTPTLSNLLENKPFSPVIGASFSSEGRSFDFAGLPASPAVRKSQFGDESLNDLLWPQQMTPSTSQTFSFSEDRGIVDDNRHMIPELHSHAESDERPISRESQKSNDLPNHVAESVLGSALESEDTFEEQPSPMANYLLSERNQNPWSDQKEITKLENEIANLVMSTQSVDSDDQDSFPFSSIQSKSLFAQNDGEKDSSDGFPITPSNSSNMAIPENFNDDGDFFGGDKEKEASAPSSGRSTPSKSVNRRKNWFF